MLMRARPAVRRTPPRIAIHLLSLAFLGSVAGAPGSAAAGPSPAEWQADLPILIDEIEAVHPDPWFRTERAAVLAAADELREQMPRLSPEQSLAGYLRIVAMLGDGHTRIAPHRNPDFGWTRAQIVYRQFPDGLRVIQVHPDQAAVLGGRVLRIGSADAEEAWARMAPLVHADNEWTVRDRTPMYLTYANLLVAVGVLDDASGCPIEVEMDDGRRVRAVIPCAASHEEAEWPNAAASAAGAALPLWLQRPERNYFLEMLPKDDAAYLLFRSVRDEEDESFADFCARAFAELKERNVETLVVDLRMNGGGNNYLNQPLIHGIIRNDLVNREGHLFVIVGRRTFSAAMCGTIDLERNTHALFVGEPTGATVNHHGDTVPITLPRTGLIVDISALYWQNSDPRDRRLWLEPDLPADLTWNDYVSGRDPALEAALAYEVVERVAIHEVFDAWLAEGATVDEAMAKYQALRESDDRNRYDFGEYQLNAVAYRLLQAGHTDDALSVFRLNVEVFPQAWNPWDSLGEALATVGRKDAAIEAYERSVELNPTSSAGQAVLRQLRRERESAP
jgi:tetratricopeptide (TPR) repeat protein